MKKRKFYCENCKEEVSERAKICPHCGRFFSAIRCPRCSYSGTVKDFIHGCPGCGYLGRSRQGGFEEDISEGFALGELPELPDLKREKGLPPWVYGTLTVLLSITVIVLLAVIFSS